MNILNLLHKVFFEIFVFFRVLLPDYWVMLHRYDKEWDDQLKFIIDNKLLPEVDYTIKYNNLETGQVNIKKYTRTLTIFSVFFSSLNNDNTVFSVWSANYPYTGFREEPMCYEKYLMPNSVVVEIPMHANSYRNNYKRASRRTTYKFYLYLTSLGLKFNNGTLELGSYDYNGDSKNITIMEV